MADFQRVISELGRLFLYCILELQSLAFKGSVSSQSAAVLQV